MGSNPTWPVANDWTSYDSVAEQDILVQEGPSAQYLDLANFDYGSLDPTLWAIIDDQIPSLDCNTASNSINNFSAFGTPSALDTPPSVYHAQPLLLPSLPHLPTSRPPPASTAPIYDPEACWTAVLSRDRSADTLFVYAVSTTKIACRASCSARRPLRANVRFFSCLAEAEAEGYRACLRCKPQNEVDPAEKRQAEAVEAAKKVIRERVESGGKIGLEELATTVNLSAFHLHRTFRKREGKTPEGYGKQVKQEMASRAAKGIDGR